MKRAIKGGRLLFVLNSCRCERSAAISPFEKKVACPLFLLIYHFCLKYHPPLSPVNCLTWIIHKKCRYILQLQQYQELILTLL
jgi:hypothetical protein